jgi:rubrerythrin
MNINSYDSTLDNGMFYTKVDNIYVMLFTALMFNDLSRVDHKVSDKVMEQYAPIVEQYKNKNQRHMYGQLNVKSTEITNIHLDEEGNILVNVRLVGRFLDYVIDLATRKKISGDDQIRTERVYDLDLKKSANAKKLSESRHCPSCGQHADLSNTGKCPSCGTIFNLEDYDYILESIDIVG